jgi:hypothetical protein
VQPEGDDCDGVVDENGEIACADADPCTRGQCVVGSCRQSNACDDGNPCSTDTCTPGTGACSHAPGGPAEVREVAFSTKVTLTWRYGYNMPGMGEAFDVVRGLVTSLPVGSVPGSETCVRDDVSTNSVAVFGNPPQANPWWFLVRDKVSCGVGSYGHEGRHGTPGPERISTSCP